VSAGFVEDDSTKAVAHDHRHLAGLHVAGVEHAQSALASDAGKGFHIKVLKELVAATLAGSFASRVALTSAFGHHRHREAAPGAVVLHGEAFGVEEGHVALAVDCRSAHLGHLAGKRTGQAIGATQQAKLFRLAAARGGDFHRMLTGRNRGCESRNGSECLGRRSSGKFPRQGRQRVFVVAAGVAVANFSSEEEPDSHAVFCAGRGRFHLAIPQRHRSETRLLDEELGKVGTRALSLVQDASG